MDQLELFREIVRIKESHQPAVLATVVAARNSARKPGARMIVYQDGSTRGTVGGGRNEAAVVAAALARMTDQEPLLLVLDQDEEQDGQQCGGNLRVFLEPLAGCPRLLVVGSGHVGRAVARAGREAGFAVSLVHPPGHRPAGLEGVRLAAGQLDAADLFPHLGAGPDSFIVIATSDHQQDFAAAGKALATGARYIAVVGSRRKRLAMERHLGMQGFSPQDMAQIVSPAGLEISAETPAEIAVSIVAQMIQVRRAARPAS